VVFTLKQGEISGPINAGRVGAVIAVVQRQEPTPEEMAKGIDSMRESLLQQKRTEAFTLFASGLRKRMEDSGKIRINKEQMGRIAAPGSEQGY